jgi:hypothetical protein
MVDTEDGQDPYLKISARMCGCCHGLKGKWSSFYLLHRTTHNTYVPLSELSLFLSHKAYLWKQYKYYIILIIYVWFHVDSIREKNKHVKFNFIFLQTVIHLFYFTFFITVYFFMQVV